MVAVGGHQVTVRSVTLRSKIISRKIQRKIREHFTSEDPSHPATKPTGVTLQNCQGAKTQSSLVVWNGEGIYITFVEIMCEYKGVVSTGVRVV